MSHSFTLFLAPIAALSLAVWTAHARSAAQSEANVAHERELDFWIGEWELTWPLQQSGGPAGQVGHGKNEITAILDGAVIQERFEDLAPNALRGMSVSVFDKRAGKWRQTWVDNQGGYIDLVGGREGDRFLLSHSFTAPDGSAKTQRMVFSDIQTDKFEWTWEASADGGKTWTPSWKIHYQRKK